MFKGFLFYFIWGVGGGGGFFRQEAGQSLQADIPAMQAALLTTEEGVSS